MSYCIEYHNFSKTLENIIKSIHFNFELEKKEGKCVYCGFNKNTYILNDKIFHKKCLKENYITDRIYKLTDTFIYFVEPLKYKLEKEEIFLI